MTNKDYIKPSLIGRNEYKYNDFITLKIPKVRDIRGGNETEESKYYSTIRIFTLTPSDMILELSEMGIVFDKISEYMLFIILFKNALLTYKEYMFDMIFKDLDIKDIDLSYENDECIFVDKNKNVIFNEKIYLDISSLLRQIMFWDKTKPIKCGNNRMRNYLIEKEKKMRKREADRIEKGKKISVTMDAIILRLVCSQDFKYNFETVNDLTVFDFWASAKQIFKNEEVNLLSSAYYSGNIDVKKFDTNLLNKNIL